jgi:hypothetical protein
MTYSTAIEPEPPFDAIDAVAIVVVVVFVYR